jgi:hypothetical protein
MMTLDGSWGVTLLVGGGLLLFLGLAFWFITRSVGAFNVPVRCPMTGNTTVVQHIADENGYLTDVVSCGAFPHGQPITCGLPCLTGGVRTCVSLRSEDLVGV